jgi:hypothetical protein
VIWTEVDWTADDAAQAQAEGWDIFDSDGSDNGPWQLQSFDSPEDWDLAPSPYPFSSDEDVWRHVVSEASTGSRLHVKALAFLHIYNRPELDAIATLYPQGLVVDAILNDPATAYRREN